MVDMTLGISLILALITKKNSENILYFKTDTHFLFFFILPPNTMSAIISSYISLEIKLKILLHTECKFPNV